MMFIWCFFLSVIALSVAQEESVSINRPRARMQQPRVQIITDQTRCFCNLPICVSTGYMCKSSSGGCFSDFLDPTVGSAYIGRHGCVEYLTESLRHFCLTEKNGQIHNRDKQHPRSLLVCCSADLCNHADNPSIRILLNNSLDDDGKYPHQTPESYLYSNSEVWFRAATIAVPICGAVILFALIAVAVKLLRKENERYFQHKLRPAMYVVPTEHQHETWPSHVSVRTPIYSPAHPSAFGVNEEEDMSHRQSQMPLLVGHEGGNLANESKNDAYAKLNYVQCDRNSRKSLIVEIGKSTPDFSVAANLNLNSGDKFSKDEKRLYS
uniref:Activin types I and II receptor domain-containing protein n=1 Tax=Dendroctonus ponderosae TaxID=77166 RepID=A0AAR5QEL9_DENPD